MGAPECGPNVGLVPVITRVYCSHHLAMGPRSSYGNMVSAHGNWVTIMLHGTSGSGTQSRSVESFACGQDGLFGKTLARSCVCP